ncbi:MAG: GntR family transcriptional regulator [Anaerolineaceae bacterium]
MHDVFNKPLYVRIQEHIAELILSGKLPPETKIQSERDFSDDLGVSRMTVRKALTELVNEGLLERRHGSGTYVAKPKVTYESQELVDYIKTMQVRNIAATSQLLEFDEIIASRRLAETLQIEIGDPIFRIGLLRFANRIPIILERIFFPCESFPDLQEWDLEKSSYIDLLTDVYKKKLGSFSQTVEAVSATDEIARQLRVDEGFPILMLVKIIHSEDDGKPIVMAHDYLRSDYARIHTNLELNKLMK